MAKTNGLKSQGEDEAVSVSSENVRTRFLELVHDANHATKNGDFRLAARLYTDAIILDPANHLLYSNRSVVHQKMDQWEEALYDARKCKELKPDWSKGYLREGSALKQLGHLVDALVSFCIGLSYEPHSHSLLQSLAEMLADSSLQDRFASVFHQLLQLKQDRNPFLLTAIVGQEFLKIAKFSASVPVLEASLRIGTSDLHLKSSVLSALSSAHWGLGNIDRAITFMQQDLSVNKSLGNVLGECRAYANLGSAYFCKGSYQVALQYRRLQVACVAHLKDHSIMKSALSHLGHVCSAIGDYKNALLSHKRCAMLAKQNKNELVEAREIGNVGAVYLVSGDIAKALECHEEHLRIAQKIGNRAEEARAYSNLGSAAHFQRRFKDAVMYHENVLKIAAELSDRTLEARAYSGLGHASRCMRDYAKAKYYHEKQLDNALQTKDKMAKGRSCSNLGIVYQLLGEYDAALKLHRAHLKVAKDFGDRVSQGRAYGNIGNAYSSMGQYDLAIRYHKQELAISREVSDKHAESLTHGNLAYAYQALGMKELALQSYGRHLSMSQVLKDRSGEARALCNIGNYLCSMELYEQAVLYYEKFLKISEELDDKDGCVTACHGLGYIHYCLGHFTEAVSFYEKDLGIAKTLLDKLHLCRAFCNLGLAQRALGDYESSLTSQKQFLEVASESGNVPGQFHALGNIGDVLLKTGQGSEAIKMFIRQLQLARQVRQRKSEAVALGNLGSCCRVLNLLDKALSYHVQELTIYQDLGDAKGESRAHSNIGNIHLMLGNYTNAYRSYEEQMDRSRDHGDIEGEAVAYGNMGIVKMNTRLYEDAVGFFEQQLALLERLSGTRVQTEQGRANRNLGDCYDAMGENKDAIRCYEKYLCLNPNSLSDQNCAYHSLGCAYQAIGSLQQALICFEKRLVIAHRMNDPLVTGCAYGELGCVHSLMGNFEQAISCLQHQLRIAQNADDLYAEAEASCALGGVHHQMAEFETALHYHQIDLDCSTKAEISACQCRAYGNLGLSCESLGRYEEAARYQSRQLSIAMEINENVARTLALTSLGRIYHAMGRYPEAIDYLQQGLKIACDNRQKEDEAKIRHRLGLALWLQGNFSDSQKELFMAVELFESLRKEARYNSDYKMSLFELQTASYQVLQRVLVALDRHDDALLVAERGRTRAFLDLILERQGQHAKSDSWHSAVDTSPITMETIMATVNRQKCAVVYFSLAAGFLYSWLLLPNKGIVKFHECSMVEIDEVSTGDGEAVGVSSPVSASVVDSFVSQAMESLGIKSEPGSLRMPHGHLEVQRDDSDSRLLQLGDHLNAENDSLGFLRMTNRSHVWNCSSVGFGSLVSAGRGNDGSGERNGGIRRSTSCQNSSNDGNKPPLVRLYDLLIGPMEDALPLASGYDDYKELVLVLHRDLYRVPFALLSPSQSTTCLYERYNLLIAPSIHAIQTGQAISSHHHYHPHCTGAVVVGNPKIPLGITTAWQWQTLPATEQECQFVAEMFGCRSLTGTNATKDNILKDMRHAEVIHFATSISWKLSAIVVSRNGTGIPDESRNRNGSCDVFDGPALSEHLLMASDVLNTPIGAKLVVINSSHMEERVDRVNVNGVIGLTCAFLAAGAQCVLFPLWSVPEAASQIFLRTFYACLMRGTAASQALNDARSAVRGVLRFAHQSNWGCWTLVGNDVRISGKATLMGRGLKALLETPTKSREAMRVVLHLLEKTLQRIQHGLRNVMYMTLLSIENRVGDVSGWQDILVAMGFRFEPETANTPAVVFFPTSDIGNRLTQCSASLQALLGLGLPSLVCLSKIKDLPEVGRTITSLLNDFVGRLLLRNGAKATDLSLVIGIGTWNVSGIHEFLASLGFELVEVRDDEVTVRLGRNASQRLVHYALQTLMAIFNAQDAPRVLLGCSSSTDSLISTSESVASPLSSLESSVSASSSFQASCRKSYFNPAEVDKLPSAMKNLTLTSKGCVPGISGLDLNLQLSHQTIIRTKYNSPTAGEPSDTNATGPLPKPKVVQCRDDDTDDQMPRGNWPRPGTSLKMRNQSYSTSASDSDDIQGHLEGSLRKPRVRTGSAVIGPQCPAPSRNIGRRTRPRVLASGSKTTLADLLSGEEEFTTGRESLPGEMYDLNTAMDSLTDSGIQTTPKHTDTNSDISTDRENWILRKSTLQGVSTSNVKMERRVPPATSQGIRSWGNLKSSGEERENGVQQKKPVSKFGSTDCGDLDDRKSQPRNSCEANKESVVQAAHDVQTLQGFSGPSLRSSSNLKSDSCSPPNLHMTGGKAASDLSSKACQGAEKLQHSNEPNDQVRSRFSESRSNVDRSSISTSKQVCSSSRFPFQCVDHPPLAAKLKNSGAFEKYHQPSAEVNFSKENDIRRFLPCSNSKKACAPSGNSVFRPVAEQLLLTGTSENGVGIVNRPLGFPEAVLNRPFPSQEDLAAPYVVNAPPAVLKDALANIPPPLPGRYRLASPSHVTWNAHSCDFNSPQSLQKASALFFRNSAERSAFTRPGQKPVPRSSECDNTIHNQIKMRNGASSKQLDKCPEDRVHLFDEANLTSSRVVRPVPPSGADSRYISSLPSTEALGIADFSRRASTNSLDSLSEGNSVVEEKRAESKIDWRKNSVCHPQRQNGVGRQTGVLTNTILHAARF